MNILGLDPGATTGWCAYDSTAKRVMAAGEFETHQVPWAVIDLARREGCVVVIEGFAKVHAGIYPQTVAAAWTGGRIVERVELRTKVPVAEITRHDVKLTLHAAIHGEFPLKKDRDVWAALLLLHGGPESAKKGGSLYGVKAHGRAALAVCVTWGLRQQQAKSGATG